MPNLAGARALLLVIIKLGSFQVSSLKRYRAACPKLDANVATLLTSGAAGLQSCSVMLGVRTLGSMLTPS